MAKMYTHKVTVSPMLKYVEFPIDMLRYDSCFPSTQTDVGKMNKRMHRQITAMWSESSRGNFPMNVETITVTHYGEKNWVPTKDRWQSFGWAVDSHDKTDF